MAHDPGPTPDDERAGRTSRATEAGLLAAAAAVPMTFQRSLTSRSTLDQAIVTGLTFTLVQTAVSTIESVLQAIPARAATDGTGADAAVALTDAAALLGGIILQVALPQHEREQLPRAGARTAGWLAAVAGTAGLVVEAATRLAERPGPL